MAKTFKYNINKDGIGKVSFKEEEEDDSKYGGPGIPDPVDPTGPVKWVGKPKKKSKKA